MALLLLAHGAATMFIVGIMWFVQAVHYPLLPCVGTEGFSGEPRRSVKMHLASSNKKWYI